MLPGSDHIGPLYLQVAEWLEKEILNDKLQSGERIYSQYQLADMFNINPATAAKALTLLLERDLIYKKRGLGMFVSSNAREAVRQKRIEQNLKHLVLELIAESDRLNLSEEELMKLIRKARNQGKKEDA